MHKKGISFAVLSVVGIFTMLSIIVSNGRVFATQTCTTDSVTGAITCSDSVKASVAVNTSCGFTVIDSGNYTLTLINNSTNNVNGSKFTTSCNSPNGYALYAVGFSGNQVGNTKLLAQNIGSTYDIQTGNGSSNWKMKLTSTGSYGVIEGAFANYTNIPGTYTKIASYTPAPSDTSTQSAFQTNYQATVSSTQPADSYVGQVKYTLIPTSGSISKSIFELANLQDFANLTSAQKTDVLTSMIVGEQYQLTDSRDGKTYNITKLLNGDVWMTSNLSLEAGTSLSSTNSNVSTAYTIPNTDLVSGDSYTQGRIHTTNANTWYNYCAASAGTICNNSATTDATYDICPAGWKLPSSAQQAGAADYVAKYSPVVGGYYKSGALTNTSNGYWWSNTNSSATEYYGLVYNGSTLSASGTFDDATGMFVRCVAK